MCPDCDRKIRPVKESQKKANTPEKRFVSLKEAAVYTSLSIWTLREACWNGAIPYFRVGRRILLDVDNVNAWIISHMKREIL